MIKGKLFTFAPLVLTGPGQRVPAYELQKIDGVQLEDKQYILLGKDSRTGQECYGCTNKKKFKKLEDAFYSFSVLPNV